MAYLKGPSKAIHKLDTEHRCEVFVQAQRDNKILIIKGKCENGKEFTLQLSHAEARVILADCEREVHTLDMMAAAARGGKP